MNMMRAKIARMGDGAPPRVLDLFAGCGGISLGFRRAGFDIVGAVELDPQAADSHAQNFFRGESKDLIELHGRARDITRTDPHVFIRELGIAGPADAAIDVIVGGPPCQAFARVGRAKLREIADHPQAFRRDPRSNLYLQYIEYVKALRPVALLMENVPDVLNFAGHNIAEEMCETLAALGYQCAYTLLNAVFYGVPEMRERVFLVALHESLQSRPQFPVPTHRAQLPRGYESSRRVALKTVCSDLLGSTLAYVPPPSAKGAVLERAVTALEAVGDLPPITAHLRGEMPRGTRRFNRLVPYPSVPVLSPFAHEMRTWPGFEGNGGVMDHVTRSLPRDYRIFRRMKPGDQYPEAHRHALALLNARLARLRRSGQRIAEGSCRYLELQRSIVPPYDPGKFPNKWRKMEPDLPARTLMAHLGKDTYSHIHYDSRQARTITVREAARLQSFPDGFRFAGTMNPAFRQIGNAVPPKLAFHIAACMLRSLRGD
ncbi:MAG: DNA cytosine methyltransferase [Steroidobacteraceae bacterium]